MDQKPERKPFYPAPVSEFARARHTPMGPAPLYERPVYQPKAWGSVRPGADDHKRIESKGVRA
jgi:hypothetical protein